MTITPAKKARLEAIAPKDNKEDEWKIQIM